MPPFADVIESPLGRTFDVFESIDDVIRFVGERENADRRGSDVIRTLRYVIILAALNV